MAVGVVGDGVKFGEVYLAVGGKNAVVDGHVDDLADEAAGVRIVAFEAALEGEGKLGKDGCVNALALRGVPAGTLDLVRDVEAGRQSDVVGGDEVVDVGNADGKGTACEHVCGGLVVVADADRDLALLADSAPGGVHSVGGAGLVIRADDKHRHRIKGRFCPDVLSHIFVPFGVLFDTGAGFFVKIAPFDTIIAHFLYKCNFFVDLFGRACYNEVK